MLQLNMPKKSASKLNGAAYESGQPGLDKLIASGADLAGFQAFKGDNWARAEARGNKKKNICADMTAEEAVAIEGYTSQDYGFLNPVLRNGGTADVNSLTKGKKYTPDELLPYINCVISGLNKLPPASEYRELYRGTNLPPGVLVRYQVGQIVSDKAFMSTTSKKEVAYAPMSGKASLHRFTIKHVLGKDVTALTLHPAEKEIMFLPGTSFRITSRTTAKEKGQEVIYFEMEELTRS